MVIEHANIPIEEEKEDDGDTIRSCCFDLRLTGMQFIAKLMISSGVLILCSYQLITQLECSYQSLYSGLIGLVVGHWLK